LRALLCGDGPADKHPIYDRAQVSWTDYWNGVLLRVLELHEHKIISLIDS